MSFLECYAMLTGKQLPIYQWQQHNTSEDLNLQNWYTFTLLQKLFKPILVWLQWFMWINCTDKCNW